MLRRHPKETGESFISLGILMQSRDTEGCDHRQCDTVCQKKFSLQPQWMEHWHSCHCRHCVFYTAHTFTQLPAASFLQTAEQTLEQMTVLYHYHTHTSETGIFFSSINLERSLLCMWTVPSRNSTRPMYQKHLKLCVKQYDINRSWTKGKNKCSEIKNSTVYSAFLSHEWWD